MRIAFLSDIHANAQALGAALIDVHAIRVDMIICLGDVVGYGPNPAETLESVCANAAHCILGNHDAALCGKLSLDSFTQEARESILWTKKRVGRAAFRFLERLPLTVAAPGFRCAHGEFSQPSFFRYLLNPDDALASWNKFPEQIMFVGHTHAANIAVVGHSGSPHMIPPEDFSAEPGKRYIVNPGSVGNPRDGDPRASYCIYDNAKNTVYWRRIPFDIAAYRAALASAGVSEAASPFLRDDPTSRMKPLAASFGFHPPSSDGGAARDAIEIKTLAVLRRSAARWRRLALGVIAAVVAMAAIFSSAWVYCIPRRMEIRAGPDAAAMANVPSPELNLLSFPDKPVPAGRPFSGWTISLDDFRRQAASYGETDPGAMGFVLRSGNMRESGVSRFSAFLADWIGASREMRLVSDPIPVKQGMKLQLSALCRKSGDFSGSLCLEVLLKRDSESVDFKTEDMERLLVKEANQPRKDGWFSAQQTFEVPARGRFVALLVRGRFDGSAWIKDLRLVCRAPAARAE